MYPTRHVVLLFSEYALVLSGTCQSNNRYEVPQADCETAATNLGLSDTSADVTSYTARPPGCIYNSVDDVLRFNPLETSETSCGSGDYNYDCICGAPESGTSLSQFLHTQVIVCFFYF
jgi:hypothetical protein